MKRPASISSPEGRVAWREGGGLGGGGSAAEFARRRCGALASGGGSAAARFVPVSLAALAARSLPAFTFFASFFFLNVGMRENTSAQRGEGANASTGESRRDAHTEYVLRFAQRGTGAQESEQSVNCSIAERASFPTQSHRRTTNLGSSQKPLKKVGGAAARAFYCTATRT